MKSLVVLLGMALSADVERLAADDFDTRDGATDRLAAVGFLAWPILLEARTKTTDAEFLYRANKLLRCYDRTAPTVKAVAVMFLEYQPDNLEAYWDEATRLAAWSIVVRSNVKSEYPSGSEFEWRDFAPWRLNPAHDQYKNTVRPHEGDIPTVAEMCQKAAVYVGTVLRAGH